MADAAIRAATLDDVPAIRAILAAHDNDGPIVRADIVGPYVRHLIVHHRALVSEHGGSVTAYGAALDVGAVRMLADLFVRPDLLGRGIGRPLLDALMSDARHRVTFASDDPRAIPSYVRAGMLPRWPCLYLQGGTAVIPPGPGIEVIGGEPATMARLERDWTGAFRPVDHEHWATQPEADGFIVVDADGPAALGYGRARQASDVRALDRLVVRPGADAVAVALAGMRRAGRGGPVDVTVPGPNPVLPVLLELRFRITDSDTFMASSPDLVDPVRLLPNGGML